MPLPKRPAPYILALLVAVIAVLTLWMLRAVTSPELKKALREKKGAKSSAGGAEAPALPKPGEPAGK